MRTHVTQIVVMDYHSPREPSSLFDRRRFLSGIARGVCFLMGGFFFHPEGWTTSELTNFRELVVVDGGQPSRLAIHTRTCRILSTRRLWLVLVFCFLEENQRAEPVRALGTRLIPTILIPPKPIPWLMVIAAAGGGNPLIKNFLCGRS